MNIDLFNSTKLAAYFLWETTQYGNALELWYCAEDIASFMERFQVETEADVEAVLRQGKTDPGYIEFLRHVAFRIYIYTNREDADTNWFDAERLVCNVEWRRASVAIARIYRQGKQETGALAGVKSEAVREYYQ